MLHSNDATNILNCLWTKFPKRPPVEDSFIRDSVAEAAGHGIDVHMMQPGTGWVPFWQSEVLPMTEQAAWKKSRNIDLHYYETYILNGGDLMRVFVEECRKTGQHPFASLRMNDQHHIFAADRGKTPEPAFSRKAGVCRFYIENPQWRIGDDGVADLPGQLSMDFAVPQVRDYRLKLIRELIDKYDIDGIELDFVRHWALFNQRKTTSAQRVEILTGMVRQVREMLDAKGARAGRYLWLGLRIPGYPEMHDPMGIDLPMLASKAGVDIINASASYYTDAQMPIAELRRQLPDDVALHTELHYTNARGPVIDLGGGKTKVSLRRCTPLQLWTTAYLARRRGADAVSTFNFQYYRGTYSKTDVPGEAAEPPYEAFEKISDLDWLAQQPQHYIASPASNNIRPNSRQIPSVIQAGDKVKVFMDMTPPAGGWRADGRLRIQAHKHLRNSVWNARLNGVPLEPTTDVSESFPTPYPDGLGKPGDYRAWVAPAALLRDGENVFEFNYKGDPASVGFRCVDVALPGRTESGPWAGGTAAGAMLSAQSRAEKAGEEMTAGILGSSAQSQQPQTGGSGIGDDKPVMLSPFVVTTDRDEGFVAAASLAGGRLGGDLKDTPVAYSVLTREFIEALGLTDLSDMAQWLPNSTEARNSGNGEWSTNDFYLNSRGTTASAPQRDFFPYGFNFDGYNIERLDIGRGPNSILFGNSSYASTPNVVSKRARTDKRFSQINVSYGSWDNFRATFDHNEPLGRKLALRLNALYHDREGWQDHDFEKRKAITLAGTWRMTRNTELRFEVDVGDKKKAALGSNFDDYFSAWSGTNTYSAPTASNAAAGIVAQPSGAIVFTPANGDKVLINYAGWARTEGGNYTSAYPAGGRLVTGETANIRVQPIANRINLPQDMFDVIEANSHFSVPSRESTSYVDAALYSEKYYNYTLALTQQFARKFYAEAAVNFSGLKKSGDRVTGSGLTRVYIDVNSKLPNGRDNPNFLEPYSESTARPHIRTSDNINARLALAYVLDNTRLGSFRFNALGGYSRVDGKQDTWTYVVKDNADHRYWSSSGVLFRYYLNTDTRRPYDLSDRKWSYLERNASVPRIAEGGLVRGELATSTYNNRSLTEYNYMQFAGDAKLFKKRLNLLAAFRIDDYRVRQRVTMAQFDYPTTWNGRDLFLKPDAPADWISLTYQPLDEAGNPSGPVLPADIRPRTNGIPDPLYEGVRFQDDYSAPEMKDVTTTYSVGGVYHLNENISFFANYAESFVPAITRYSIEGTMLGVRAGEGRDFGIRLTALDGRFVANIIYYTGLDKNAFASSISTFRSYVNTIASTNPVDDLTTNGLNKRNLPPPPSGITDTITNEVSGWELEITANLTRSWRLLLNASLTDAYQTDTYPHVRRYLAANGGTLRQIVEDAGGMFEGNLATFDTTIDASRSREGPGAVTAWNNLQAWTASLTNERQKRDRLVESVVNIFTDYTFRSGPLRGLRIGAGANHRGRSVIGYRGADTMQDPDNPAQAIDNPFVGPLDTVYQPGYTTATATAGYNWRINRKRSLNISLRVTNLFDYDKPIYYASLLRPVNGDLDTPARTMTPVNYYWITPRNFILTASLKF
ncbi:MAG: TonB-dependent receptor [Opitutaceae bacterium]|nr:TonB-dependent receptor [Opitutaceae bacterium]